MKYVFCFLFLTTAIITHAQITRKECEQSIINRFLAYHSTPIIVAKIDSDWLGSQKLAPELNGSRLIIALQEENVIVNTAYCKLQSLSIQPEESIDPELFLEGYVYASYVKMAETCFAGYARDYFTTEPFTSLPFMFQGKEFVVRVPFSYTKSGKLLGPLASSPLRLPLLHDGYSLLSNVGQY